MKTVRRGIGLSCYGKRSVSLILTKAIQFPNSEEFNSSINLVTLPEIDTAFPSRHSTPSHLWELWAGTIALRLGVMVTPILLNVAIPEKLIKLFPEGEICISEPIAQCQRCSFEIIKYLAAIAAANTAFGCISQSGALPLLDTTTVQVGLLQRTAKATGSTWVSPRAAWEEGLVLWYLQEVGSSLSHQEEWKSCLFT